jgi:hypothetical protein
MFSHGSYRFSPWIDPQRMKSFGAMLIWDAGREGDAIPPELAAEFPNAISQPQVTLDGHVSIHRIGLAFVPPEMLENLASVESDRTGR